MMLDVESPADGVPAFAVVELPAPLKEFEKVSHR